MPIYGRGLLEERDDPDGATTQAEADPKYKGGLREGAATWSNDGRVTGNRVPGACRRRIESSGHVYMTGLAVDVHRRPRRLRARRAAAASGPGTTELRVEYLFSPDTLARPDFDMRNVVDFTNLVMTEDADVCELNQQGLHAASSRRGVVMPEEYVIRQFHEWVASELTRA